MRRRTIVITIALLCLLNLQLIFADSKENSVNEVLYLNLEKCIELTTKNNPELLLIDKRIEIAQKNYLDAYDEAEKAKTKYSYVSAENLEYRKEEKLNWQYTRLELEELKNSRNEKLKSLKNSVQQYYLDAQLLKDNNLIYNQEMTNLDKKLTETQLKIKLGQLKESDYKSLLSQKKTLQISQNDNNKQYETTLINLKKSMGIAIDKKIELEKEIIPYVTLDFDSLAEKIKSYIEKDFDIAELNKKIELKQLEKDLTIQYSENKMTNKIPELEIDIEELKANVNTEKLNLEADLWIEYYNIQSLQENIELEELNLQIEELNYQAAQAKVKAGLLDPSAETTARISYNRQKNNLQHAMYSYVLSAEQFNNKLKM